MNSSIRIKRHSYQMNRFKIIYFTQISNFFVSFITFWIICDMHEILKFHSNHFSYLINHVFKSFIWDLCRSIIETILNFIANMVTSSNWNGMTNAAKMFGTNESSSSSSEKKSISRLIQCNNETIVRSQSWTRVY